jgi:hypothetical protein
MRDDEAKNARVRTTTGGSEGGLNASVESELSSGQST